MAKASSAREDLISAAIELFRARGFEGVGVAELLEQSGAPRGSLYFHFPGGKEQIGVEAVDRVAEGIAAQYRLLASRDPDLETYVDTVFKFSAKTVKDRNFDAACPVCAIAAESSSRNPALAAAVAKAFALWETEVTKAALGWGMSPRNAAEFANALVTAVEGAMVVSKMQRNVAAHINGAKAIKALGAQMLAN